MNALFNLPGALTFAVFSLLMAAQVLGDLGQSYCSSQNTGSSSQEKYWTWQSNGWCYNQCVDSYAFAVVQGNNCWCSNYIPADQQDLSNCNSGCPGINTEQCGNTDSDLYGYIALTLSPSGTQGASSAAASSTSPAAPPSSSSATQRQTTVDDPETVFETVTASPSSVAPSSATPASSTSSTQPPTSAAPAATTLQTSSVQSSSSRSSSSWTPTPVTSVQTLTVSGVVVTQTVTSMSSPPAALTESQRKGSSAGVIAGAVVGALAGLALLGALLFWFFFWRRRSSPAPEPPAEGATTNPPRRNTSTLSRTGLLKSEKEPLPPVITTMNRRSRNLDHESISPISERRNSRPLFYDQRLNPSALMDLDNGSHTSIVTIEDNRDYTRTLNIRNPDPDTRSSFNSTRPQ